MLIDPCQHDFIYKKASFEVFKIFKINKQELWLLSCLNHYLGTIERNVVSRQAFLENITNNNREIRKMHGYCHGLLTKGFIGSYEYLRVPGSTAIGISDLGVKALESYLKALELVSEKYPMSKNRIGHIQPAVTLSEIPTYRATA